MSWKNEICAPLPKPVLTVTRRSNGNQVSKRQARPRRWSNSSASPSRCNFRKSWKSGPPKTKERSGNSWRTFDPLEYTSSRRDSVALLTLLEDMVKGLTCFRTQPGRTTAESDVHRFDTVERTA